MGFFSNFASEAYNYVVIPTVVYSVISGNVALYTDKIIPGGIENYNNDPKSIHFSCESATPSNFNAILDDLNKRFEFMEEKIDDEFINILRASSDKKEKMNTSNNIFNSSAGSEPPLKKTRIKTAIDDKITELPKENLPDWIKDSFKNGDYRTVEAKEDMTLYRVYGGGTKKEGSFLTTQKPMDKMNTKVESALPLRWENSEGGYSRGNSCQNYCEVYVPKGTKMNIGKVAEQKTASGNILSGGADQVLVSEEFTHNSKNYGSEQKVPIDSPSFHEFERKVREIQGTETSQQVGNNEQTENAQSIQNLPSANRLALPPSQEEKYSYNNNPSPLLSSSGNGNNNNVEVAEINKKVQNNDEIEKKGREVQGTETSQQVGNGNNEQTGNAQSTQNLPSANRLVLPPGQEEKYSYNNNPSLSLPSSSNSNNNVEVAEINKKVQNNDEIEKKGKEIQGTETLQQVGNNEQTENAQSIQNLPSADRLALPPSQEEKYSYNNNPSPSLPSSSSNSNNNVEVAEINKKVQNNDEIEKKGREVQGTETSQQVGNGNNEQTGNAQSTQNLPSANRLVLPPGQEEKYSYNNNPSPSLPSSSSNSNNNVEVAEINKKVQNNDEIEKKGREVQGTETSQQVGNGNNEQTGNAQSTQNLPSANRLALPPGQEEKYSYNNNPLPSPSSSGNDNNNSNNMLDNENESGNKNKLDNELNDKYLNDNNNEKKVNNENSNKGKFDDKNSNKDGYYDGMGM